LDLIIIAYNRPFCISLRYLESRLHQSEYGVDLAMIDLFSRLAIIHMSPSMGLVTFQDGAGNYERAHYQVLLKTETFQFNSI
jgi:hypothetical protein